MSVNEELNKLGRDIVTDAKATVPVDTGALKNSIKYEYNFISLDKFNLVIEEKYYGVFVDKGTNRQRAQPYMTNAIKKNLPKGTESIINTITGEILNNIKNINK